MFTVTVVSPNLTYGLPRRREHRFETEYFESCNFDYRVNNTIGDSEAEYWKMFTRKINSKHRPASNLDKYENEEYMKNPLLRFHLDNLHKRRHLALLKLRVAEIKTKLSENDLEAKPEPTLSTSSRNTKELSACSE
uniref:Uncharacterized protein n=1 Tax=Glossina austeni TaxID=7395 RepID=A0A1A9VTX3_GLOAU